VEPSLPVNVNSIGPLNTWIGSGMQLVLTILSPAEIIARTEPAQKLRLAGIRPPDAAAIILTPAGSGSSDIVSV